MSKKALSKSLIYLISANIISVMVSGIILLIFPRLFSIAEFGIWQFYMLLNMYFSYAAFGLADGVYVRYSEKQNINKIRYIGFHFWLIMMVDVLLIICLIFNTDISKIKIMVLSGISCILVAPKSIIVYHLQSIGKTTETSFYIIIEKLIFVFLLFIIYTINIHVTIFSIVYVDLLSKLVTIVCLIIKNPEKFKFRLNIKIDLLKEITENFKTGIPLVLIGTSTLFIIGIFRFVIEKKWGIESFSKASIMINFSSFLMIFISSISLIFFPLLRNTELKTISNKYNQVSKIVFFLMLLVLMVYYPIYILVQYLLPDYSDGLIFLPILLVITILDGKIIILNTNLLKIFRKEKKVFIYNLYLILLTIFMYLIILYFVNEIFYVFILMMIVILIKYILLEYEVQKILGYQSILVSIFLNEFLYVTLILPLMYFTNSIINSLILFVCVICIYLSINKDIIKNLKYFVSNR